MLTLSIFASCSDEAAADLTAFLDFSSFDQSIVTTSADNAQTIALPPLDVSTSTSSGSPSFNNAFAYTNPSPLRPVDDALLDSPLGLELSPAESFTTSSISGSPYDLEMSLGDFNGDSSPLFSTVSYNGSPAVTSDLVFPSSSFAGHGSSLSLSSGTPGMITTAELPSLFAALPLVAAHELADIKPMVLQAPPPPQHNLARHSSTESVPFSFEDLSKRLFRERQKLRKIPRRRMSTSCGAHAKLISEVSSRGNTFRRTMGAFGWSSRLFEFSFLRADLF